MTRNKKQKKTQQPAPKVTYWHGGAGGRMVGDDLLPGTQIPGYGEHLRSLGADFMEEYAPDFVYITSDRDLAFDFAVRHAALGADTAVYQVAPKGKPSHDGDFPAGVSFRCRSARILAVDSDGIKASTKDTGAALGYVTWDDGAPMYDTELYPLPSKALRHLGVTPDDLRSLGRGPEFDTILARCSAVMHHLNPGITQAEMNKIRVATGGRAG